MDRHGACFIIVDSLVFIVCFFVKMLLDTWGAGLYLLGVRGLNSLYKVMSFVCEVQKVLKGSVIMTFVGVELVGWLLNVPFSTS